MQMQETMDNDDAWDAIVRYTLQFGGAVLMGALFFLDILILDVHWKKAMIVSWLVIGCVTFKLGVWTIRKMAIAFTAYAFGYLIGALPKIETIGAYLTRLLTA